VSTLSIFSYKFRAVSEGATALRQPRSDRIGELHRRLLGGFRCCSLEDERYLLLKRAPVPICPALERVERSIGYVPD